MRKGYSVFLFILFVSASSPFLYPEDGDAWLTLRFVPITTDQLTVQQPDLSLYTGASVAINLTDKDLAWRIDDKTTLFPFLSGKITYDYFFNQKANYFDADIGLKFATQTEFVPGSLPELLSRTYLQYREKNESPIAEGDTSFYNLYFRTSWELPFGFQVSPKGHYLFIDPFADFSYSSDFASKADITGLISIDSKLTLALPTGNADLGTLGVGIEYNRTGFYGYAEKLLIPVSLKVGRNSVDALLKKGIDIGTSGLEITVSYQLSPKTGFEKFVIAYSTGL